jgi:hypothetical protein
VGVEASSEIQTAARKVLEENKKLRTLLSERGVPEAEVIAVLGGSSDRSYEHISAAPALSAMLERRITCNGLLTTSSPVPSHTRAASMPRHTPSVPPISIPASRPTALSCYDTPSPGSIVSSMGTPPPASYPTSFYSTPMTPSAPVKTEAVRYSYTYEQPSYNNTWNYSDEYNMVPNPATYYNTSSCVDAANIIRTMRADVQPEELEADLGCRAPDQNCYVNNNVVFNMMDKYSNTVV